MTYGICALSLLPLREAGQHTSPLVSEVLYGEIFTILTPQKYWSKVRLLDKTEGWLENSQFQEINLETFTKLAKVKAKISIDLVEFICKEAQILFPVPIGSAVQHSAFLGHTFDGAVSNGTPTKKNIREMASMFLNSPFRQGGKSPFGIDAAGFVQIVYALCGIPLPRTTVAQASVGEVMSFIEESETGDLAFFDNKEGEIIHVGIILENNHIIHAHGKVRIDRIDQSGIYNAELRTHTYKLRLLKSIA